MKQRDFIDLCGTDEVDQVKKILSGGMRDFDRDEGGLTALMLAAEKQRPEMVRMLIDAGANVNQCKANAKSPLYRASCNGNCEVLKMLLQAGADVDYATKDQMVTPLITASNLGHIDCVQELIAARANVNMEASDGHTALSYACNSGHVEIIYALAAAGAVVEKPCLSRTEKVPLVEAILSGMSGSVRALLDLGASPNFKDNASLPMIMYSACDKKDDPEITRMLIADGADIQYAFLDSSDVNDPIYTAAAHGNSAILKVLLSSGGRIAKSASDILFTPIENGHLPIVKLLTSAGADVNYLRFVDRVCPVLIACEQGHEEMLVELYRAGATLDTHTLQLSENACHRSNSVALRPQNALIVACERDHEGIVRMLISGGADVDYYCPMVNATPLFAAIRNRNTKTVQMLIEGGANLYLNCSDRASVSPILLAIVLEEIEIVGALLAGCPALGIPGVDPNNLIMGYQSLLVFTATTYLEERKSLKKLEALVILLLKAGADIDGFSFRDDQTLSDRGYPLIWFLSDQLIFATRNGRGTAEEVPMPDIMGVVRMLGALGVSQFQDAKHLQFSQKNSVSMYRLLCSLCSASFLREHTDCVIVGHMLSKYRGRRCKVVWREDPSTQSDRSRYVVNLVDQQTGKLDQDNASNDVTPQSVVLDRTNLRRCCGSCGAINTRLQTCGECLVYRYCASPQCCLKASTTHKHVCQSYESNFSLEDKERVSDFLNACRDNDVATVLNSIEMGVDVDYAQGLGCTGMHAACQAGALDTVRHLIQELASVNLCDSQADSPLHIACQYGHTQIARALLMAKAGKDTRNTKGRTPLHHASEFGHAQTVKLLLSNQFRSNVNAVSAMDGKTSLMLAAAAGWVSVVRILLESSANVELVDSDGATALALAERCNHSNVVDEFNKHVEQQGRNLALVATCTLIGLDGPDAKYNGEHCQIQSREGSDDEFRWKVLLLDMNKMQMKVRPENLILACSQCFQTNVELTKCIACKTASYCTARCQSKHESAHTPQCHSRTKLKANATEALNDAVQISDCEKIKFSISIGADVNAQTKENMSLLFHACFVGNVQVVDMLLAAGADIDNVVHHEGRGECIPLLGAVGNGHSLVVKSLIKAGADVDIQREKDSFSALHIAAFNGDEVIVKLLLDANADCTVTCGLSFTPLNFACSSGNANIVELLISAGANVNHLSHSDSMPLIDAINKGHEEILRILLAAGANVNLTTAFQSSALLCAAEKNSQNFAQILIDNGADVHYTYEKMIAMGSNVFSKETIEMLGATVAIFDSPMHGLGE